MRFCTYNLASTLDGLALTDKSVGTEEHDTDLAGLEVHAHALDTGGEPVLFVSRSSREFIGDNCDCDVLDELLGLDVVHAVDTGNTVTGVHVSP
jgi:hypothetical protein